MTLVCLETNARPLFGATLSGAAQKRLFRGNAKHQSPSDDSSLTLAVKRGWSLARSRVHVSANMIKHVGKQLQKSKSYDRYEEADANLSPAKAERQAP
jgi:hypothetical protein